VEEKVGDERIELKKGGNEKGDRKIGLNSGM